MPKRRMTDDELDLISDIEVLKEDVQRVRNVRELANKALSRCNAIQDEGLKDLLQAMLEEPMNLCDRAAAAKVEKVRRLKMAEMDQNPEDYDYGSKGTKRLER